MRKTNSRRQPCTYALSAACFQQNLANQLRLPGSKNLRAGLSTQQRRARGTEERRAVASHEGEEPESDEDLQEEEWADLVEIASMRGDHTCPICMNHFSTGSEIILSCSHLFHKTCLASFEKFACSLRRCPICRTEGYLARKTSVGSEKYRWNCAIRIQALLRGYSCRLRFLEALRDHYRNGLGDTNRRDRFYRKEFTQLSDRLVRRSEEAGDVIEDLIK
jgi:hypothetical protein